MTGSFLGHTRFSLYEPSSPSWRLSRNAGRENPEEYFSRLYAASRMDDRVTIFFDHTLPLLEEARRDFDLHHVVSYSAELPDRYEHHLTTAATTYDWLHLDRRDAHNRKGKELNAWARDKFAKRTVYAEYRLDDDDLLASTYFQSLSSYLDHRFVGFYVSHGYGVQAYFDNGVFKDPRIEHRPKIAIGLARICQLTETGEVIGPRRVAHTQIDRHSPVIVDSKSIQFLHSIHLSQDSGVAKPDDDLGKRFRNYLNQPSVNQLADLHKLFSGVRFKDSIDDKTRFRALIDTHANIPSIAAAIKSLRNRFKSLPRYLR